MRKFIQFLLVMFVMALVFTTLACFAQDVPAPAPAAEAPGGAVWQTVISLIMAVVVAARIIVKLTPTPKDDTILEKIVGFLKHIGLNIGSK